MALQESITAVSYAAASVLEQFVFVRASTTMERTCELATAPGDTVIGVTLINATEAGHAVGVVIDGIAKVRAGGVIAIGAMVGPNALGKAAAGGTAGVAITSAGAEDEILEVQLL